MKPDGRKLPTGKLPNHLLKDLLAKMPIADPRVRLGPGVGLDCAVVDFGDVWLVVKSDPITFATEEIGWYSVHVNANDIVTTGATPRWFLATLLLPENGTTPKTTEEISRQIYETCLEIGVAVIGGHTEITHGLDRPIVVGTMIGEVKKGELITPRGMQTGNEILLTKGVPIEATSILARECRAMLEDQMKPGELDECSGFLYDPGISIIRDAQIAQEAGKISAMHDPTEGGVLGALWELAEAANCSLCIDPDSVPIPVLSQQICNVLHIDPLASIASGALLITALPSEATKIRLALDSANIPTAAIGHAESGPVSVFRRTQKGEKLLLRPETDEIARLLKNAPGNDLMS